MNILPIEIVQDSHEAVKNGHFYREPVYKGLTIEKVVVVRNGTESGKPTVDFVLVDEQGQKYVFMLTGALVKMIPCEG